ncbi:putative bifunctional diguanylate cyclase/phosphodiesterase [Maricaulis parjimensis]|uniref:putative bifunctional diguanylate cyclase/phosphodiesterase n=1 Tax=Maricaulis parjimensis TaxID=144023 RepID=UPI001939F3F1|nr:EAL domain-containing protein [Maricaulis parjimensis]
MRFRSLRTKLAVIYAGLFALVILAAAGASFYTVQRSAARLVQDEMAATAAVFDRIWALNARQMGDAADILARDFGFRAAVATADVPTIESALDNLKQRFEFDVAFVIDQQGQAIGAGGLVSDEGVALIEASLTGRDAAGGVVLLDGAAFHAVARPVRAPTHVGWVVFAYSLSTQGLNDLTELSAIPLQARLFWQSGAAVPMPGGGDSDDWQNLMGREAGTQTVGYSLDRKHLVSAIAVNSLSDSVSAFLVLQYPVAQAMAPFRTMMLGLLAAGLVGLAVILLGSWLIARGLSKPIQALERAAGRLAKGQASSLAIDGQDEISRLAHSFNAMGEQIAAREKRITHLALHDPETGLPNLQALEQAVSDLAKAEDQRPVYAISVGIDRFHQVRGAIGFALSSQMVISLARRLEALCPNARLGRVSTDAIGLVLTADSRAEIDALAARIVESANAPVILRQEPVDLHATVGVAGLDGMARAGLTVIECAGVAIDQARGRQQRLAWFDAEAYGDPTRKISLMSRMSEGLNAGHLYLSYQPKYDFRTQTIQSCEALLRWEDPELGFIGPDDFIPMAEETGHILPLTEWVLDRAIADQVRLKAAGFDLQIAVNVSGRLISDARFIATALDRLRKHSGRICFEITETAVIENPEQALHHMAQLREAGIIIAIDDYGSGLSSLAYLRSIPAEELKIDKAFVLKLDESREDRLLVKSTIDLAHSLGLKVVAEGVETADSVAILAGMGADYAQGYHIGRPMPLSDFLTYLKSETEVVGPAAQVRL